MNAENIAHIVVVDIIKPKFAKFVGQPSRPGGLTKRRRRNASDIELPTGELSLLRTQPGKR